MFPANAGMNRTRGRARDRPARVPRKRGDEPAVVYDMTGVERCSPQTRDEPEHRDRAGGGMLCSPQTRG